MTSSIEQSLSQLIEKAKVAGLQVAVINKEQGIWTQGFGYKNRLKKKSRGCIDHLRGSIAHQTHDRLSGYETR